MPPRTRALLVGAGFLTVIVAAGAPALATGSSGSAVATDTSPPSAVEDFNYPGAEKILEEQKIKLIRGDGRITLTDCKSSDVQIKVNIKRDPDEEALLPKRYCFTAKGKAGYLALNVPHTFYLETIDHPISAQLTSGDKTTKIDVAADDQAPVGEGILGNPKATLVELRVTG